MYHSNENGITKVAKIDFTMRFLKKMLRKRLTIFSFFSTASKCKVTCPKNMVCDPNVGCVCKEGYHGYACFRRKFVKTLAIISFFFKFI